MKRDARLINTENTQKCFDIKKMYNFSKLNRNKQTYAYTDASRKGIGANTKQELKDGILDLYSIFLRSLQILCDD